MGIQMREHNLLTVAVSVATVWSSPESPRSMDEPALQRPARIVEWLAGMAIADKLDLCDSNRIQTQLLYGATVIAVEERGDWVKVHIPAQHTRKSASGYPGWVPKRQLTEASMPPSEGLWAEVTARKAVLYGDDLHPMEELSFLTRLPVLTEADEWVRVNTPEGSAFLKAEDVRLVDDAQAGGCSATVTAAETKHAGQRIVEQGTRFLGLPYLWGGMSAFGYDCSGFAYNMHLALGIVIPRDASDQVQQGTAVERTELEPGDLLFFAYEEGKGRVHHVGIYAGDNRMIHSPDSGSCIETVNLAEYKLIKEHCASRRYWV